MPEFPHKTLLTRGEILRSLPDWTPYYFKKLCDNGLLKRDPTMKKKSHPRYARNQVMKLCPK